MVTRFVCVAALTLGASSALAACGSEGAPSPSGSYPAAAAASSAPASAATPSPYGALANDGGAPPSVGTSCAAGPQAIAITNPAGSETRLHFCADVGAQSCPELASAFPDAHTLDLAGVTYTDRIPDTLDLATWAAEYYHATLSLMLPTEFIQTLKTIPVPSGSFAPGSYVLYHEIPLPEGGEQTCSGAHGPCINGEYVPQWGVTLQSLRRAREMFGNAVAPEDATREWLSMRGIFAYDQTLSTTNVASTPGNANNTASYSMMLLNDLYREYPGNQAVAALMNEYVRYKDATVDPTRSFWLNTLASQFVPALGFDGRGGYFNDNYVRLHHQANNAVPLSDWFVATHDARAFDLGERAAAYVQGSGVWSNPNPARFAADGPPVFVGHTLSYATALSAALADARARVVANAADPVARNEIAFVRNAYEFAKRRGEVGLLGNFGVSSYLGEMLRIGVGLESFRFVYPDLVPFSAYYEDVERWTRNQAAEARVDATVASLIPDQPNPDPRFDHIGSRATGTFLSDATHVTAVPFGTFEDDNDGLWLMRGLYDVWKNTVQVTTTNGVKVAWVNLLLNNAAPDLDVYSEVPYRGRVIVAMRKQTAGITQLAVRIPSWAGDNVTITEDYGLGPQPVAKDSRWGWADRYVSIAGVRAGAVYSIQFPMIAQRLTVGQLYSQADWWNEGNYAGQGFPETNIRFGATFVGDVMVQPDGRESGVPRYQRQTLAALVNSASPTGVSETAPPVRTVTRFVSSCSSP